MWVTNEPPWALWTRILIDLTLPGFSCVTLGRSVHIVALRL